MKSLMISLFIGVAMALPTMGQTLGVEGHDGASVNLGPEGVQVQGQRGSTWLGRDSQGDGRIEVFGPRGNVFLHSPSGSPSGSSGLNSGLSGFAPENFLPPILNSISSGLAPRRESGPQHWTFGEAEDGSLILSEPNIGTVVLGQGTRGKSSFTSPEGSFTIDNDLLFRVLEMNGNQKSTRFLRGLIR